MNRLQITLLTLIITVFSVKVSFSQSNLIEQDWLAVKSEQYKKGKWMVPIDGSIFTFTKEKLYWQFVYSDSTLIYDYSLKGKNIVLNDTIIIRISFLSKDSMKLVIDKRTITTFIPIDKEHGDINISAIDFIENNWTYKTDAFQQRIDFLEDSWEVNKNDISRVCITHTFGDKYCYQNNEKWSLYSKGESKFLSFTWGQHKNYTHQIIRQNEDTVFTKLWNGKEFIYPILIKHNKIVSNEREIILNRITSKEWRTIEIIDYSSSFNEDTIGTELESTGFYVTDTTLISKQEFLDKKIKLLFSDTEYKILINDKVYVSGKWRLSIDGKYIILNSGLNPSDYIALIEISNKYLIIGKSDEFSLGIGRNFIEYYYRLKLE